MFWRSTKELEGAADETLHMGDHHPSPADKGSRSVQTSLDIDEKVCQTMITKILYSCKLCTQDYRSIAVTLLHINFYYLHLVSELG